MKRVIIVVESIDVDDSSGSKANVALINNLKQAGYELRVYHYTLRNLQLPGIPCIAVKENRRSVLFFLSRIERYLRDYLKLQLHRPLQKIFGFSFTLFNDRNSIVKVLQDNVDFNPDLVITLSKGGSFRPHHALLKMPELHSRWLAYMHDPYPMHHYPRPYTWFEPGYKKKEDFVRQISEKAAFTAFPSWLLLQWMGQFYPLFLHTGEVIPHQVINLDVQQVRLPQYFNPENFNLLHAGNLFGARNPKGLLAGFMQFLHENPEAKKNSKLIFIGGNNARVREVAGVHSNIFASVAYIDFEQVYKMQQTAAVNIILEAKAEISPFLPGKFPHCVWADKAILHLGPEKSETKRLLGTEYPYWSKIDDGPRIADLISNLYAKWKVQKKVPLNRPDLNEYMGPNYLKHILDKL